MPEDRSDKRGESSDVQAPLGPGAAASADAQLGASELGAVSAQGEGAIDSAPSGAGADSRPIEELTLSELLGRWWRAPGPTWRQFRQAMTATAGDRRQSRAMPTPVEFQLPENVEGGNRRWIALWSLPSALRQADSIQLILYGAAILSAMIGSVIARGSDEIARADGYSLHLGGLYLWLGFLLWLIAEAVGSRTQLEANWQALDKRGRIRWAARALPILIWIYALHTLTASMTAPYEVATDLALAGLGWFALGGLLWIVISIASGTIKRRDPPAAMEAPKILNRQGAPSNAISRIRKLHVGLASMCSLLVWINTSGNRIEPPVILLWLLSAGLWGLVFAPLRWNAFDWAAGRIDSLRRIRWRHHRGTMIAFALVMLLGAAFRFYELDAYPPQKYSDLVEKIQDAYKIRHFNDYRIFLANIGGREPLHFYLLSILASQPGMAFDHYALKLMSALESFITLPIMFWLGVEVMGKDRRRLGLLFGALAAALVAVSFWHVVIGRQGMRISLAPLFSALTAVYLARALRYNRRSDYVKAGLALGFGLMGYQAVRMLPLAAVAGVAIAALMPARDLRARLAYFSNLGVLAFVSFMVFLPMLHYWLEEPENYMRRTDTRIFGDSPTTADERASFLLESIPVLMSNIRKTALMAHYYGDNTWVSGIGHEPALDPASAAFLVLGIAAWLALMARTRDPAICFLPVYLLATLLPTALALSFPIEVPSFIRASGAIPPMYLLAALPIAVFCVHLCKKLAGRAGKALAVLFAVVVLLSANHYNSKLYFGEFTDNFARASYPLAQAGKFLRGFAESDGAYGNAFVLTSPHWWDVRAVGIEAGEMFWDSGGDARTTPQMVERGMRRSAPFRLDPERDLLFFYSRQNMEAQNLLTGWFPAGRQMQIDVEPAQKSFFIFRAPALGAEGLQRFLDENRQT